MSYEKEYNLVVFKYAVYDANFLVFPASECPATGFSSLYRITPATAETLYTAGISGYKGPVWSPQLVIDFDNEEAALEAGKRLRASGLAHEVWETGNRGLHYYIDRPHAPSHMLPQIDKEWVRANFPRADLSIYSNLHMFRLPGALHDKTGRPKKLVQRHEGAPLILADAVEHPTTRYLKGDEAKSSIFLNSTIMNWTVPWDEGNRHSVLVSLGVYMKKLGEPPEFIARWLYHTNLLFSTPKPQDELERIIQFVVGADAE